METSPTKKFGLEIYGNMGRIDEYIEVYGKQFVDQCLDLAITKCKPKSRPQRKPAGSSKQYRSGFTGKKTKAGHGRIS